ncbi:MAG: alpha/beta fold hydrolase [Alphaproteobacteria bacterium]
MQRQTPLLLIASQLCTARVWQAQIDALRPGVECRTADHTRHDSMTSLATSILNDAPASFALAAHGMGGFIAFEIMRQAPNRVDRLALFDTLASADSAAQTKRRQRYADLVHAGQFDQVVEDRIPILLHPNRQNDTLLLSIARQMAAETGPDAFLRQQAAIMARQDSRPDLKSINCPTLVALGRQDRITSVNDARTIADGVPGARLEVIENCGHLAPLEQPEQVTQLLKEWLEV